MQNYDTIKTALKLLREESAPRLVLLELELVSHSILKISDSFDSTNSEYYCAPNVEGCFIDQFFQNDGIEIYEVVRGKFCSNEKIVLAISVFADCLFSYGSAAHDDLMVS